MQAWHLAADANHKSDLEPWAPAKLYYHHGFSYERVLALHEACLELGIESPYKAWLEGWDRDETAASRVTARIHCANWFHVRDAALKAHATQIDPDGNWFAVPREVQMERWPTEDYELALSRIGDIVIEDDLFYGLRGD